MSLISYPIRQIGPLALAELHSARAASLLGVTSRGMFLLTDQAGVIFLSVEEHPGPWSANMLALPPGWQATPLGKNAQIQAGRIILPAVKAYFDCAAAQTWQPPTPDTHALDLAGIPARCAAVKAALSGGGERGFSPLLGGEAELPAALRPVQAALNRLCEALLAGDTSAALLAGEQMLGFGSGLTPSGDDLLAGVLLALIRWEKALPFTPPADFAPALVAAARQRTTALSAALLQAAALGIADQRLLLAADGLVTDSAQADEIASHLLAYGHSSGLDFWIGFAQVMTLIP